VLTEDAVMLTNQAKTPVFFPYTFTPAGDGHRFGAFSLSSSLSISYGSIRKGGAMLSDWACAPVSRIFLSGIALASRRIRALTKNVMLFISMRFCSTIPTEATMSAKKRRKIYGVRRETRRSRGWTRWFQEGLFETASANSIRLRTVLWGQG
jgi:hypothetical protein